MNLRVVYLYIVWASIPFCVSLLVWDAL